MISLCLDQLLPLVNLVRGIPCAKTKRLHLHRALMEYLTEFDSCKCDPCPNNARPALSGTECVCICQTGTYGANCEKRAPDYKEGSHAYSICHDYGGDILFYPSILVSSHCRTFSKYWNIDTNLPFDRWCQWSTFGIDYMPLSCTFLMYFYTFPVSLFLRGCWWQMDMLDSLESLWRLLKETSYTYLFQPRTSERGKTLPRLWETGGGVYHLYFPKVRACPVFTFLYTVCALA